MQTRKTKRKLELLNREHGNFQHYLKTGEDGGLFRNKATREPIGRLTPKKNTFVIRKDLMDIRKDNELKYWARIPMVLEVLKLH
ncbi:hypothetical protein B6U96_11715 [Archaeoglobales archaeon ex4484_92]|nr:MAG: hypothetical protein B6U96_11715 [Archaeoglobales archaeon ex4484_92]